MSMFMLMVGAFFAGVIACLSLQLYLYKRLWSSQPKRDRPFIDQFPRASIPPDLHELLSDPTRLQQPETCYSINLLIQFLWKELKDTNLVRHWMVKKLSVEFKELLTAKALGHFMDNIVCRAFSLGPILPVIQRIQVENAKTNFNSSQLEELDLLVDLDYPEPGGFELALDIDMVFRRSIHLCIRLTSLKGRARVRLTRTPYTHWSFAFVEEPQVAFKVDTQSHGRSLPQIPNLIIEQIKRTLRKRHTLPYYKIRYKPFFPPQPSPSTRVGGSEDAEKLLGDNLLPGDTLTVNVVEFTRLRSSGFPNDARLFATISLDSVPWSELLTSIDIEIHKNNSPRVGLSFKDSFVAEKGREVVLVEAVEAHTPAMLADVREGDIVVSINDSKVATTKHALLLMRKTGEMLTMKVERGPVMMSARAGRREAAPSALSGLGQHYHIEEDIVRIPRKKTVSNPPMRRNSSASGAEEALIKFRAATASTASTTSLDDERDVREDEEGANDDGGNDDDGDDDDDDDEDNEDDSYVNITLTREDPIAEAMKVVEVSGSVDEKGPNSFSEGGDYGRPMSSSLLLAGGGGYLSATARDCEAVAESSSVSTSSLKHPHRNSDTEPVVSVEKGNSGSTSRRQKLTKIDFSAALRSRLIPKPSVSAEREGEGAAVAALETPVDVETEAALQSRSSSVGREEGDAICESETLSSEAAGDPYQSTMLVDEGGQVAANAGSLNASPEEDPSVPPVKSRFGSFRDAAKRTTTTIFSTINRRRERSSSPAPSTLPASLTATSLPPNQNNGDAPTTTTTSHLTSSDSKSTPPSPSPGKRLRARSQDRGPVTSTLSSLPFIRGDKRAHKSSKNSSLPNDLDGDLSDSGDNLLPVVAPNSGSHGEIYFATSSLPPPSAAIHVPSSVSMSTLSAATLSRSEDNKFHDLKTSSSFKELPSIVLNKGDSSSETSPPAPPSSSVLTDSSRNRAASTDGLRRRVQTTVGGDVVHQPEASSFMARRATVPAFQKSACESVAAAASSDSLPVESRTQTLDEFRSPETWSLGSDGSREGKMSVANHFSEANDGDSSGAEDEDDDDDDDNGFETDSDVDTADEDTECGVRQTRLVRASDAPQFEEKFQFTLSDPKSFINVVLWCKCPEILDKAGRLTRTERDELCGYVSLPVSEIVLQCITTTQGDHRETVHLTCPEPLARASRSSDPSSVSSHRGHDPLLMDGDVTIAYQHRSAPAASQMPRPTTKGEEAAAQARAPRVRRVSSSSLHKDSKRQKSASVESRRSRMDTQSLSSTGPSTAVSNSPPGRSPRRYSPAAALTKIRAQGAARAEAASALTETNHVLLHTHFSIATICDSCRNKIWTRKAFQCKFCLLICHRKCIGKFQSDAICSREKREAPSGNGKAEGAAPDESKARPPSTLSTESLPTDQNSSRLKSPIRIGPEGFSAEAGGFSLNFRAPKSPTKETVKGLIGKSIAKFGSTPRASPAVSTHNSPDLSRQLEDQDAQGELEPVVDGIPRKEPSPGYQIPSSPSSSSEEKFVGGRENEEVLSKLMSKCGLDSMKSELEIGAHDEVVVSMAKSTGKELFADLVPEERKQKLEEMTSKLQLAIDNESENRSELARELKCVGEDLKGKQKIEVAIQKSEDRMQSMAVLMLHYCSGLADCLENFDSDKEEDEEVMSSDTDEEEDRSRPLEGDRAEGNHPKEEEQKALEHRGVVDESTRRNNCDPIDLREEEEEEDEEEEEEGDHSRGTSSINDGDVESGDDYDGEDETAPKSSVRGSKFPPVAKQFCERESTLARDSTLLTTINDGDAVSVGGLARENGVVEVKGAVSRISGGLCDSLSGASEASEAEEALDVS